MTTAQPRGLIRLDAFVAREKRNVVRAELRPSRTGERPANGVRVRDNKDKDVRYLRMKPSASWLSRRSVFLVGAVLALLFLFFPLLGENGLPTYLRLRKERNDLQQEIEDLRTTRRVLEARIEALENDPDALEKLARERFNMHRPGEEVLVIKGDEPEKQPPP